MPAAAIRAGCERTGWSEPLPPTQAQTPAARLRTQLSLSIRPDHAIPCETIIHAARIINHVRVITSHGNCAVCEERNGKRIRRVSGCRRKRCSRDRVGTHPFRCRMRPHVHCRMPEARQRPGMLESSWHIHQCRGKATTELSVLADSALNLKGAEGVTVGTFDSE